MAIPKMAGSPSVMPSAERPRQIQTRTGNARGAIRTTRSGIPDAIPAVVSERCNGSPVPKPLPCRSLQADPMDQRWLNSRVGRIRASCAFGAMDPQGAKLRYGAGSTERPLTIIPKYKWGP